MFAHFRHSEKARITPESLPPTGQPITKPPPTPLPFSPPPPPVAEVPAQSPSLSESFSSIIKTILSVSASTFLKPSNISIAVTPDRRVTLESTQNSSFEVSQEAPTQAPPASTPSSVSVGLIAGIAVAAILVLFILGVIFIYFIRKKKPSRPVPKVADNLYSPKLEGARSSMEKEQRGANGKEFYRGAQQQQAQPMQAVVVEMARGTYTFDELSKATNGFSQDSVLGQGGFGQVFKGTLYGMEVAVKKLKTDGSQGDREFRAEVDIISRVHHKNLVSLVGHCIYQDQRLLVYEFVSNKTLDFHLRGNGEVTLNWQNRYKIALGAAKGLAYLHEDCDPKIIHRDIKASNILLDLSFEAKVADFGLAKYQQTNETHVTTRVMGTFGYIAPEFATSGRLTEKADVYAFGVVLLELITGKGPYDSHMDESLVGWARPLLDRALDDGEYDGLVDPRLGSNYDSYGMQRMMQCASAAVRQTYRRRPAMIQLVQHLQGEILAEDLNAGMTPGHSSAISFGSGTHSSDFNSGIKRNRAGPRDYASSEFSDLSSNQNTVTSETHEKLAR